jgi:hypothetical protein
MTKSQKALLSPLADKVGEVLMSDDQTLEKYYQACSSVSETNCGWATYHIGRMLLPLIADEQKRRAFTSKSGRE